jgi:very-short-patch-repair endonuclease
MLRRSLTISEARVWSAIKNKALGVRFRRQVPIGPWIVDFACLNPKLVVEIDDESHLHRAEIRRTRYLERMGFTVLRFWNVDVAKELEGVVGTIENWVEALRAGLDPEV